jgi:hypothetical protein
MDSETVRVVFRAWKSGDFKGEVNALFPDLHEPRGLVSCYAHVGQHGVADYRYMIRMTRPATQEEYAPLLRELTGAPFFYKFHVIKRANPRRAA